MNQNLNSGAKKKRKFNFVDVIILILIIAAVALVALVFSFKSPSYIIGLITGGSHGKSEHSIYYAVEVSLVNEKITDGFDIDKMRGNTVTESKLDTEIGKIAGIIISDGEYVGGKSDGQATVSSYPGYKCVTLIMQTDADSVPFQAGKTVYLNSAHFSGAGFCTRIKTVDKLSDEELNAFTDEIKATQIVYEQKAEELD